MQLLNTFLNKISSFINSIIFHSENNPYESRTEDKILRKNKLEDFKVELPFFILKHAVTLTQWQSVMPYNNEATLSWNEMNEFIEKVSQELKINFRLPTHGEWEYAQSVFPMLKLQVHSAEISFWIYNRPYGTIID